MVRDFNRVGSRFARGNNPGHLCVRPLAKRVAKADTRSAGENCQAPLPPHIPGEPSRDLVSVVALQELVMRIRWLAGLVRHLEHPILDS